MLLMVKRMLSIMGIVELLRAVKCCTWYNVLLLSLIAAAVCMRRLPYYTEILLLVWVLAIVAFALFMSRMKEVRSIGFWHILPCALMLPIFFYSAVEIRRWPQGLAALIFVTLGCTVNDVGAYFVGRAFGTHKLAPIISPGKTVEGGLGGMVSSVILMSLIASLYSQCAGVEIRYFTCFWLPSSGNSGILRCQRSNGRLALRISAGFSRGMEEFWTGLTASCLPRPLRCSTAI